MSFVWKRTQGKKCFCTTEVGLPTLQILGTGHLEHGSMKTLEFSELLLIGLEM